MKFIHLTRAEKRVVVAIANGIRPNEAATRLGLSETTFYNQLAHIYRKVGIDPRNGHNPQVKLAAWARDQQPVEVCPRCEGRGVI